MNRKRCLLACGLGLLIMTGSVWGAPLLRDGLYAKSVPARVVAMSDKGPWFLEIHSEIKDKKIVVPKGTRMELLPCSMLEIILGDAKVTLDTDLRVWAKIAQYHDKNYVFLMNYFSLSPAVKQASDRSASQANASAKVNRIQIPEAVRKRMAEQPVVHSRSLPKVATVLTNKILINRLGYVRTHKEKKVFVFDGLGYSVGESPVQVLPCRALERIECLQNMGVGPYRFSIAGMTTVFRGQTYIYLQRALRVFNHGNFGQ